MLRRDSRLSWDKRGRNDLHITMTFIGNNQCQKHFQFHVRLSSKYGLDEQSLKSRRITLASVNAAGRGFDGSLRKHHEEGSEEREESDETMKGRQRGVQGAT